MKYQETEQKPPDNATRLIRIPKEARQERVRTACPSQVADIWVSESILSWSRGIVFAGSIPGKDSALEKGSRRKARALPVIVDSGCHGFRKVTPLVDEKRWCFSVMVRVLEE